MSINGTKRSQETCNDSENSKKSKWEGIEDDDTNSPSKKDSSELNKDRLVCTLSTVILVQIGEGEFWENQGSFREIFIFSNYKNLGGVGFSSL